MNIHEYQAKTLLREAGIQLSQGVGVEALSHIDAAIDSIDAPVLVVKAQIHAGGRGKGRFTDQTKAGPGGGVRVCRSKEAARNEARAMFGEVLVTHQTGPQGKRVNRIFIEAGAAIAREYYLSLLVDRAAGGVAFIASTEGGMDIEAVAAKSPERIAHIAIDPATGIQPFHTRLLAKSLHLKGNPARQCADMMRRLYGLFLEKDCALLEINPLVETEDGRLLCLDCKMSFDSNALYRHPELMALRDESEEDPRELQASKFDLNYIALDGDIGCMVNGAGLAMATMDIIKLHGSEPANFLDVGGGASAEKVTEAFKIITSDKGVKGILVNIFGGIMRCDIIAEGVIEAVNQVGIEVPLVVRLEGTNVEKGKRILSESGLNVIAADDLGDAARKVVQAVGKAA